MKKNDLSAFQSSNLNQLEEKAEVTPKTTTRTKKKKAGAPTKPANEKASKKVLMSFTPKEYEQIQKKAGAVRVATFLKIKLQEGGII